MMAEAPAPAVNEALVGLVRDYQSWLAAHGFYKGEINGQFDEETRAALVEFQRSAGLSTSGTFDLATTNKVAEMGRFYGKQSGQPAAADPTIDKVRELYGPAMAAYLDHAELGPILRQAAAEGWDDVRLQGRIEQTDWWRSSSDAARRWEEEKTTNPGEAERRRASRRTEIVNVMSRLGIAFNDGVVGQVVEDSLRLNLDTSEIMALIGSMAPQGKSQGGGEIGAVADRLRAAARGYYLKPGEDEIAGLAQRIAVGNLTEDGALSTFRQQAKTNHPFLAESIDAGGTVEDYFAEHRRRIAQALEINTESVDLMNDPKWWPILGFVDGKGQRRPMTWGETISFVNRLPEADGTARLNQKAAETANFLRDSMLYGRV